MKSVYLDRCKKMKNALELCVELFGTVLRKKVSIRSIPTVSCQVQFRVPNLFYSCVVTPMECLCMFWKPLQRPCYFLYLKARDLNNLIFSKILQKACASSVTICACEIWNLLSPTFLDGTLRQQFIYLSLFTQEYYGIYHQTVITHLSRFVYNIYKKVE